MRPTLLCEAAPLRRTSLRAFGTGWPCEVSDHDAQLRVSVVTMRPMLLYLAVAPLVGYCGFGLILYLRQSRFVYWPKRGTWPTPNKIGLEFEDVVFRTSDGLLLNGWYVPAGGPGFTVLFCHGNGGNIAHRLDSISLFHDLGLSCFIFDYRGYGDSEGKPTEKGTYLDAEAAYRWLTEQKGVPPNDIVILGRSLGGSVATYLAGRVKARALVAESTFTSYVDMAKIYFPYMPVRWFARFGYNTGDYIKKIDCPVMLIHSRDDEVVPFKFGLELYWAANEPKEFVAISGSHNDGFLVSGDLYRKAWQKWLRFLEEYETGVAGRPCSAKQRFAAQDERVSQQPRMTRSATFGDRNLGLRK